MLSRVSHTTVWVADQNEALRFYTEALGFEIRADQNVGNFRWLTVGLKDQPEFEIALMPFDLFGQNDGDSAAALKGLVSKGKIGGTLIYTKDIQKAYEAMQAKGVEFVQPPTDRGYAIEAIFKDNSGNVFSLHQDRQ